MNINFLKENKNKLISIFPITLLCLIAFYLIYRYSIKIPFFEDSIDIMLPALNHLQGGEYPSHYPYNKYPTFPSMFYELFFIITSVFLKLNTAREYFQIGRIINVSLFTINVLLFYLYARSYFDRIWALLACLLLLFSPAVFFSGIVLKTESLLLTEILLCLYSVNRIQKEPDRIIWHVIAAVSCALSVTTKYNVLIFIIYLSGIVLSIKNERNDTIIEKITTVLKNKNILIFSSVVTLVILITWPTIWEIKETIKSMSTDIYRLPYPSFMRAVDEWFSFPYGRYSYSLTTMIPVALGICNYLFALLALGMKLVPKQLLITFGIYSLIYIVINNSLTLVNPPYMFTPIIPFMIICAVFFMKYFFESGQTVVYKMAGTIFIISSIICSIIQYPTMYNGLKAGMDIQYKYMLITKEEKDQNKKLLYLFSSEASVKQGIDIKDIEGSVNKIKPDYIITLNSYFLNFRKYSNPDYKKQYAFYEKLKNGQTYYMCIWDVPVEAPLKILFIDPEMSIDYTLFKRINRGSDEFK